MFDFILDKPRWDYKKLITKYFMYGKLLQNLHLTLNKTETIRYLSLSQKRKMDLLLDFYRVL